MFVKILGIIDITAGIVLFCNSSIGFKTVFLVFGMILLSKSILGMLQDFASWIDLISAIIFFLMMIFSVPVFILVICGILLLQKGILSFF